MAREIQRDTITDARILIIEDDRDIARILRQYTEHQGWHAVLAHDGAQGLTEFRRSNPDLVLLDINMPKRDGFSVLQCIRADRETPVIVLSARIEDQDKLKGLDLGADDYVVKPFNPKEVMARIKAVLHRARGGRSTPVLRAANVSLNTETGHAWVMQDAATTPLELTPSEFRILHLMLQAPRKVFARAEIRDSCFPNSDALDRTIDSHVSHLRKKLNAAGVHDGLTVSRGLGYRFSP